MSVFERENGRTDTEISTDEWDPPDGPQSSAPADAPQVSFPIAFRGYDRATVDEYLEDIARVIEQLERGQSPEDAVKRALEQIGDQTSAILQRAHEAEENITARARAKADATLRAADTEARSKRRQAEAKVRALDEDTELLWQERHRLLEDLQRLSNQLGRMMTAANRRFPPPADTESPGASKLEDTTVRGEEDGPEAAPPEETLGDSGASVGLAEEELAEEELAEEELPVAEIDEPEVEEPEIEEPEIDDPVRARRAEALLDEEELDWDDAPEYRPPAREEGDAWDPHSEDAPIAAYRMDEHDGELRDDARPSNGHDPAPPLDRAALLDRLLSPGGSDQA